MKTVGIIAEYNPFHNGHAYQIQEAKRLSRADFCIVIMSGDFVQRGEPAIFDKYTRTKMALSSGADLVLELPVCFAVSSAEFFAAGAVSLLDHLGCTDFLCFGSESGSDQQLSAIAEILAEEPAVFRDFLQKNLRQGMTYPAAVNSAYENYCSKTGFADSNDTDLSNLLSQPNNLLGIEYLKALRRRRSSIQAFTIPRIGQHYHAQEAGETYSSASAIRNSLTSGAASDLLSRWIPSSALDFVKPELALSANDFSLLLGERLLYERDYDKYAGISQDFANRLAHFSLSPESWQDLAGAVKTKQYTYSHISRGLLHLLLHIRKEDLELGKQLDYASYIRILGIRRESAVLLKQIKSHSDLPLINKLADAIPDRLLQLDISSAHLYRSVLYHKTGCLLPDEYRAGIVIF